MKLLVLKPRKPWANGANRDELVDDIGRADLEQIGNLNAWERALAARRGKTKHVHVWETV